MIRDDWSRRTINHQSARIKRMFKWAVSQEMFPPYSYHAVQSVVGLRKGSHGST
jgi:hypothetical protein